MKKTILTFVFFAVLILTVFLFFEEMESQLQQILENNNNNLLLYSFFSFLILSSDIVLPVPSSLVMHFNGMTLGILGGTILSFVSLMISSIIGYYIGQFTEKNITKGKNEEGFFLLNQYGPFAILLTRGIPILSESISLLSGYNRMNIKAYLLFSAIGYFPLCLIYAAFGSLSSDTFFWALGLSIFMTATLWFFGKQYIQQLAFSTKKRN